MERDEGKSLIPKVYLGLMKNLNEIAEEIETRMSEKDRLRDEALTLSRNVIKKCSKIITGIHKGEQVDGLLSEAKEDAAKFNELLGKYPDLYYTGYVENAFSELAEAFILHSLTRGDDFPKPEEIGVTDTAYLLGLGDVIGELRRMALDALRVGYVNRANSYLDSMEELFSVIMKFDYPSALIPIRRKQDIARSLIERTRSELVVSIRTKSLEDKLDRLNSKEKTYKL